MSGAPNSRIGHPSEASAAVDRVVDIFGAQYSFGAPAGGGYLVNHSTGTYLLDANKAVRFLFDHQDSPQKMAAVIQSLFDAQKKDGALTMRSPAVADTSLIFAVLRNPAICGVGSPEDLAEDYPFWFVGNDAGVDAAAGIKKTQPIFPLGLTQSK